ncbi:MAG: biotin--[acetyl-CoA-carboxylase] ligase [Propionibacteriaceae bacterium]|nr:biotin--[acetyl-CoA-carboxylase] ligase [Propionibacteriaceae bacterium]
MPQLPAVSLERIAAWLEPDTGFAPITVVAETGSTSVDLLAALAKGEATAGAVLIAEHQSAGRGRFTREWVVTPGSSLTMSLVLEPGRPQAQWGWLSLLSGMAVAEAVRSLDPAQIARVELKWPNDVLVDGRKVCGIIADGSGKYAVIGIGVNVGQDESELPVPTATSLALTGLPADKSLLAARILGALSRYFKRWQQTGDVRAEYMALSATLGRKVRVILSDTETVEGEAVGLDTDGSLLVAHDGTVSSFSAGDVVHLR